MWVLHVGFLFCSVALGILSSFANMFLRTRKLIIELLLCCCCLFFVFLPHCAVYLFVPCDGDFS